MDSSEIQMYEMQLASVSTALSSDPENQELVNLHKELTDLIALTKQLQAQSSAAATAAAPAAGKGKGPAANPVSALASSPTGTSAATASPRRQKLVAGDECSAKYSGDGRWYPARVTSVGGSPESPVYTVVFKGYDTPEVVPSSDVRPSRDANKKRALDSADGPSGAHAVKLTPEEEAERERKKKRNEKKTERRGVKASEAKDKQNAWQKFAKKGAKKGYDIAGASGKSQFKTPDDPLAKIGVVGAGRGMTNFTTRTKHVYEAGSSSGR